LLYDLSKLSDTIYLLDNNVCGKIEVDLRVKKVKKQTVSNELADLLSGDNNLQLNNMDNNKKKDKSKKEVNVKEKINKVFNSLLDDIYNTDSVNKVDLEKLKDENFDKLNKKDELRKKRIDDKIDKEIDDLIKEDDTPVSKKEITPVKEESTSTKKEEVIKEKAPLIKVAKVSDLNIKSEFFKNHKKGYTIVLLTGIKNKVDENYFINKYKIEDNVFIYKFKTNGNDYVRVLYGFYDSVKNAELAMKKLNQEIQTTKPYIDNIKKHQKLYEKYKSSWGSNIE
jgi:adhesin transport system outer membrane protein